MEQKSPRATKRREGAQSAVSVDSYCLGLGFRMFRVEISARVCEPWNAMQSCSKEPKLVYPSHRNCRRGHFSGFRGSPMSGFRLPWFREMTLTTVRERTGTLAAKSSAAGRTIGLASGAS